jgi:PD-(D/E)XK nuclease superfamily
MSDNPFIEFGVKPELADTLVRDERRIAVIRTSDRINFRSCRRRWGWQSHLRHGLGSVEHASPLWFGSGMHYALEDFHGPNHFGHPVKAFKAYAEATQRFSKHGGPSLPGDVQELITLSDGMMGYYADHWLRNRPKLETYIHNGVPQVEVHVLVPIDMDRLPLWVRDHYNEVLYAATLDRVIIDEYDRLWIVEYKSARAMETAHFMTDPQCTAYMWVGTNLYDLPIGGVIYQQHKKDVPEPPRILADGSVSKMTAGTTYALYYDTMRKLYTPEVARWPTKNLDALNALVKEENDSQDAFIRRDRVSRSIQSIESEGEKILLECEDMLNPNLPLYPNPNRLQCSWCSFQHACVDMDDGSDFQNDLELMFQQQHPTERDSWRKHLILPNQQPLQTSQSFLLPQSP